MIVTSDNPRSEDPDAIVAEIVAGGRRRGVERRGRPPRARSRARSRSPATGDVVVIAGKGHEQGQEFEDGRKEPFDDVDRRPRGAACARWSPERDRRGGGRAGSRRAAPATRRARRVRHRLARGRRRRPVRRPARASASTAARSPRRRSRRALGRARRAPSTRPSAARPTGAVIAADDPLAGARSAWPRAWRRELGAHGRRHHRLDRQDVDEGHPRRRCCAPQRRTVATRAEPQHRDRPAADDARRAGRHRGARARDGDARRGPDRRAGGDRRARRRRDRQRRARCTSSCSARSRRSPPPRPS